MTTTISSGGKGSTVEAAVTAFTRGYVPIAIRDGLKRPHESAWVRTRWPSVEAVREAFEGYPDEGASGVGLLLGEPSGGLIDVDLDHPKALRLAEYFLPPSEMAHGRPSRPGSHRWYRVEDEVPPTRPYRLPDKSSLVELRSTGAQSLIPPSMHPDNEPYRWEGEPWGGEYGPSTVQGRRLSVQVALLAMGAVLLDKWPRKGGRHEAYLALAGGLLRYGKHDVHPKWEQNLPILIAALASVTNDDDGPDARVKEVMGTTVARLRAGGKATGFPALGNIIGQDHAELVRRWARDVEELANWPVPTALAGPDMDLLDRIESAGAEADEQEEPAVSLSLLPPEDRNPLAERPNSWAPVDLEPYLSGKVTVPEPNVLNRSDGQGLFYPGRVNSLYGPSESAKSWIALFAAMQAMNRGERVLYLDFEDEPVGTVDRLTWLGAAQEDVEAMFRYVHPESPIAELQRGRFSNGPDSAGRLSSEHFAKLIAEFQPRLIIADGMTSLYGLHGHDTNDASATDVVTTWLKKLCRYGRATVIVIDHTGKGAGPGASPIGAHHKIAMVQGTSLRVDVVDRPMPGEVGTIRLVIHKDRLGVVRANSTREEEPLAAVVTIDSRVDKQAIMTVDPGQSGTMVLGSTPATQKRLADLAQKQDLADRLVALFHGDLDAQVTTTAAAAATGASRDEVLGAWQLLITQRVVDQHGERRWAHYRLTPPPPESSD